MTKYMVEPPPRDDPPQPSQSTWQWIVAFVKEFEEHPVTKMIVAGAFLFTLVATWLSLRATQEQSRITNIQLEDLKSEQTARYWQLLTTPASGNSGKVEAIEELARRGTELVGLDFSCSRLGGGDATTAACENGVYLRGLTLRTDKKSEERLAFQANVSGADLGSCRFEAGVNIVLKANQTNFAGCEWNGATVSLVGEDVQLDTMKTTKSQVEVAGKVVFNDADLQGGNVFNIASGGSIETYYNRLDGSTIKFEAFDYFPESIIGNFHFLGLSDATFIIETSGLNWLGHFNSKQQAEIMRQLLNFDQGWFWKGSPPKFLNNADGETYPIEKAISTFELFECDRSGLPKEPLSVNFPLGINWQDIPMSLTASTSSGETFSIECPLYRSD
ncbi:hypothetical protein FP2506_11477 [Fulvimarina pelagi HTCC2506]|uniref:Pentapeptide repeat-containing protein n=1 Tax=Fulvimarina pelagi HTCC2506 TaxID=314231 RepID=Q0FYY4_9HYPH|nr:hypothetical protein [Fulvimarina pelagi]EAU40174.1 hypothetical protein FP2506_11477 [Fulvimarina pelagi HTCC2506]